MQSLPFWELWTGTEKRVKLKAYDERVLSGHHEDEKEREKSLTHDNLMADILIFLPSLFFRALERERVQQFYSPHVRVSAVVFQRRGRELYT